MIRATDPVTSASIAVSGGHAVIAEDGSGADEANPDGNAPTIWMETVFGAVFGVIVLAVLLAALMVKRRRSLGKKEVTTEVRGKVHVAAVTPSEVTVSTTVAAAAGNTEDV